MKTEQLYEKVTNTIIELLEKVNQSDYQFAWFNIDREPPKNIFRNNRYSGINFLYLSVVGQLRNYPTNYWMTFNDIQQMKGKIKKGSKAAEVIFYKTTLFDKDGKPTATTDNATDKKRLLKYYHVFNVADVEGLPEAYYIDSTVKDTTLNQWEKDERAEQIIRSTGANVQYIAQNRAFYRPSTDTITLPIREQFTGAEPFYATCFHELIHWTKTESRCNRKQSDTDKEYAFEELVAELGATFICSQLQFDKNLKDHAIYIKSWLTALQNDKKFIFKAGAYAQRAADYILSFEKSAALEAA